MKRGMIPLITAGLIAGVGTAQAYIPVDLVANGGFDGLSGSEPNTTTTSVGEWFSIANDNFAIKTEGVIFGNAAPSVRWHYNWGADFAIAQNLGVMVESGKSYEVELSHAIDYVAGPPNDNTFEVSIWTSATTNGTYALAKGLGNVFSTNTVGLFSSYVATFDAVDLAAYVGEYMQLRVTRTSDGHTYDLHIDDVKFGKPGAPPAPHPTLARFDTAYTTPEEIVADLTAAWTGNQVPRPDSSSTDGTYGTIQIPAAEAILTGAIQVISSSPVATLTLVNTNDKAVYLDDIHFDAARFWPDAPQDFSLTTSGDITVATLTNASGIIVLNGKSGNFDDFGVTLTNLADHVLNPNEEAVFTWTFSNFGAGTPATVIDNVLVGGTVSEDPAPYPAILIVSNDEVSMPFVDATSILTNTFDVSYNEGNPATNMNVSSVSVINDASGGFSVTPTSFVLNDPTPSNQVVEVIFNNNTALLDPNEVATADIEVVWNEFGSSVNSTSTVSVSASRAGFLEENVVAAFHSGGAWNADSGGGGDADISINGIETLVTGIEFGNNSAGSDDTSYGTLLGNAPDSGGAAQIKTDYSDGKVYIALTNNTQSPVELDTLHFDYASKYAAAPSDSITVTLDGDLGNGIVLATVSNLLNSSNGIVDYDDIDIDLTALADLQDGEGIVLTFEYTGGNIGMIDNVAFLGTGFSPAVMGRVGGSTATLGVSGLDLSASQDVDLIYYEGDLETNVVVTGVSFANQDIPGAFSAVGSFPVLLPTAQVTNSAVFSLVFDNTVANLAAGESASAEVIVAFDEPGGGSRTYTFDAYAGRPADVPTNGVLALFDTEFLFPDAAYNGLMSSLTEGFGKEGSNNKGSEDGDYGSLVNPAAPVNNDTLRLQGLDPVTSLTITNQTEAAIDLSMLHFDIGQWFDDTFVHLTLDISGDVTATNLLDLDMVYLGYLNNDLDDHDIDLTGLADHSLGAYESVTFTWTVSVNAGKEEVGIWLDNIALMGTADVVGGWANYWGLTSGVNDGPNQNPDGDSKDNLMEYATGGDPMTADGSAATLWDAEEGGTNWLYHVHNERKDDDSLTYPSP